MSLKNRWQEFKVGLTPRIKEWRFMLKRMRGSSLAMAGLIIILGYVAMAILAPVIAPPQSSDPFAIPLDKEIRVLQNEQPTPPTFRHIFGTTQYQFDLFYGCIWGSITAFRIGVFVVAISLLVGLLVGTASAYYGGILDETLMRFTDIIIAFPGLILAMALVLAWQQPTLEISISLSLVMISVMVSFVLIFVHPDRRLLAMNQLVLLLGLASSFFFPISISIPLNNLDKVLVAITIVGWPGYARVIRGEVLRIKNEDYVEASRASGSSDIRTIMHHILPNSIYPLLIVATLDIGSIVLSAAALSFIGIGAPEYYADWGQLISRSRFLISDPTLMVRNIHTFLIPGLFISTFVVGWNLLGDALRDVLDPMLRRR